MSHHSYSHESSPAPPPRRPSPPPTLAPDLFSSMPAPFDEVPVFSAPAHVPASPWSPAKQRLPQLSPSSPVRPPLRSVTAPVPPSPTKSARLPSPLKSVTDPPRVEYSEKARSASAGPPTAATRGSSRSREQSKVCVETDQPVQQRREKAYIEKLKLYETKTKLYIIGCDDNETLFSVLKIDRVAPTRPTPAQDGAEEVHEDDPLPMTEDPMLYSRQQKDELIETLKAGNGGAIKVTPDPKRYRDDGWHPFFYGIAGFVRLSSSYRLVLITQRHKVALIGGHYVYHNEGTQLYPVTPASSTTYAAEDYKQEAAFSSAHLSKNFYFSYTYDITNTLQRNLLRGHSFLPPNDKFAWNWHLLTPLRKALKRDSPWLLPLVHGAVDQTKMEVFGRRVYITLIGRRSRHFAGARFLRRGVNEQGWVANDVESEQIVSEFLTTPFHVPAHTLRGPPSSAESPSHGHGRAMSPRYTSFVQHRGSIPFYWSQDVARGIIKPEIYMTLSDPYYVGAAQHFDQLFDDYGRQIVALNLIKHTDNREATLIPPFRECIAYLNQFLPDENKIEYIEFDDNAAKKQSHILRTNIIIGHAEHAIAKVGFFHSGPEAAGRSAAKGDPPSRSPRSGPQIQTGVLRTNCIDCLDRTNTAQNVAGRVALSHQLCALGFLPSPYLSESSDANKLLDKMYQNHGDLLAQQYAGSGTVSTVDSTPGFKWKTQSRDKVEGLKRIYTNQFVDMEKQAAIDLYLGITPPLPPPPSFEYIPPPPHRDYQNWYTPSHLTALNLSSSEIADRLQATIDAKFEAQHAAHSPRADGGATGTNDGIEWWKRYYRTSNWTTLAKFFPFKMASTLDVATKEDLRYPIHDSELSPFLPRDTKRSSRLRTRTKSGGLRSWIEQRELDRQSHQAPASLGPVNESSSSASSAPADPPPLPPPPPVNSTAHLATSLLTNDTPAEEVGEYSAWISQFQRLSLAPQDHLGEKDRAMYAQHASFSFGEVNERDRMTFQAAVVLGGPAKGFKTEGGVSNLAAKAYREFVDGPQA